MRFLHTSDWHLGHRFHGRQRYEEQGRLLDWLTGLIEAEAIDVLLVAGDIFDTTAPGGRAQSLYYRFLHGLAASSCRHVVIIGGNHDSPALLEAPRELLRRLDIHVVGLAGDDPDKEVLVLRDGQGRPEMVVCAVPFLRDRDIRLATAGETLEDKVRRQREAIGAHYQTICGRGETIRQSHGPDLPLVAMGHLFVAGGRTVEGDGVRELSVGGLDRIDGATFPASIDYLALGHLHLGQTVAGDPARRYCGAPLPMSFAEAGRRKEVLLGRCQGRRITVEAVTVPAFQPLASLRGDLNHLLRGIEVLQAENSSAWVELHYEGEAVIADLRERLMAAVDGSTLTVLRIRNSRVYDYVLRQAHATECLDDLSVDDVFERCLEHNRIEPDQRRMLREAFAEITGSLTGRDDGTEQGP